MTKKSIPIFSIIILLFFGCSITKNKERDKLETNITPAFLPPVFPNMHSTNYPENDGLTYSVYLGETFSGYELANGWRLDTINGSVNNTIGNPYLKITNSEKNVSYKSEQYHFYIYEEGKLFNGLIRDTVRSENRKELIFEGYAKKGLIQGHCKFYFKTDTSVACKGNMKDGEMVDNWFYYNYDSNDSISVEERTYVKNVAYPTKTINYKISRR